MRLALFDIDGTLLSAKGAGKRALEGAIEIQFGIKNGLAGVRLDGKTDPQIIREALSHRPKSDDELLSPAFREMYRTNLAQELARCHHFVVLPGVHGLLTALSEDRAFKVGVATGNMQEGAALKLEKAGLSSYFSFGGYGSDSANRTEVIQAAIMRGRQLTAVDISEVFVIGDTLRDVIHGKEAGARVIAVATGSYTVEKLRRGGADLVLKALAPARIPLRFMQTWRKS